MKWNYNVWKQLFRFFETVSCLPEFLMDQEVRWYKKAKVISLLSVMVIYVINPIDLIVDFLFLGLGYVEDIFIVIFLLGYVCDELELYLENKEFTRKNPRFGNFENKKDCDIIDVEFVSKDEKDKF